MFRSPSASSVLTNSTSKSSRLFLALGSPLRRWTCRFSKKRTPASSSSSSDPEEGVAREQDSETDSDFTESEFEWDGTCGGDECNDLWSTSNTAPTTFTSPIASPAYVPAHQTWNSPFTQRDFFRPTHDHLLDVMFKVQRCSTPSSPQSFDDEARWDAHSHTGSDVDDRFLAMRNAVCADEDDMENLFALDSPVLDVICYEKAPHTPRDPVDAKEPRS